MTPVKLQMKNFMSYRSAEVLDFTSFDLAILSGNNGVGKSSILEAITWALWGKSRASLDDNLVYQGETAMWVEFLFDYEGNRYRVLRSRETKGRGSTSLEFQITDRHSASQSSLSSDFAHHWKPLTGPTIKQTQEMITKTLRLDYDLFVNSSYLRQGHADEFTTKIPAQRKEILAQILDLSLYDQLEEKAKQKKRGLDLTFQLLTAQVVELTDRLLAKPTIERDFLEATKEKERHDRELSGKETALKTYEEDQRKFESMQREIVLLRERFEELNRELQQLQTEEQEEKTAMNESGLLLKDKAILEKQFKTLKTLRKEYEELNEKFVKVSEIQQEVRVIAHEEQQLHGTIERLRHVTICPTCLRTMSKKEAEGMIDKLTKQFASGIGRKKKEFETALHGLKFRRDRFDTIREELADLEEIEEKKRQLDVAAATIEKSRKILGAIAKKIRNVITHQKTVEEQGKELSKKLNMLKARQAEWETLEADLTMLRKSLATIQDRVGGLKDRLRQIVGFEQEIGAKNTELTKITDEISTYNELSISFGKKGVQAMIIEQTVPQIEEGANFLLQKITSGRMQVKFITQRAKKADENEIIETLDIEISDELGSRPYEQYSGGEAFRINFAIRVALAKLLTLRARAKLRFLVVDEGFGALDTSGREDIVASISGIREDFSKIIVVTHIEEFKNLFPTRIEVTKDAAGSHIQLFAQ